MATDNHHIDQLFREQIKGFGEKPPVYAWDKLKEDIYWVRRKRKAAVIRWSAAAAAIVIAFLTGYFYALYNLDQDITVQNQPEEQTTPIQNLPETLLTDNIQTEDQIGEPPFSQIEDIVPQNMDHLVTQTITDVKSSKPSIYNKPQLTDQIAVLNDQTEISDSENDLPVSDEFSEENIDVLVDNEDSSTETPAGEELANDQEINIKNDQVKENPVIKQDNIAQYNDYDLILNDDLLLPESKEIDSKWSVGGVFAPVYAYRDISIQSEDLPPNMVNDESYYNNTENGMYSFSGGLDVEYKIEKKWSFLSGLVFSRIGQVNEDIIAMQYEGDKYNYYISTSIGPIDINSQEILDEVPDASVREDSTGNLLYFNSNIYQNFEYLEIPLVFKYRVFDKRLALHLAGGLSPGLMVNNTAYFQFEETDYYVDRSEEFYPVIYNSIVGIGLDYALKSNLHLSFTPSFKYSLNSIRKDHSIQYHPYSISLYTGISYSF